MNIYEVLSREEIIFIIIAIVILWLGLICLIYRLINKKLKPNSLFFNNKKELNYIHCPMNLNLKEDITKNDAAKIIKSSIQENINQYKKKIVNGRNEKYFN